MIIDATTACEKYIECGHRCFVLRASLIDIWMTAGRSPSNTCQNCQRTVWWPHASHVASVLFTHAQCRRLLTSGGRRWSYCCCDRINATSFAAHVTVKTCLRCVWSDFFSWTSRSIFHSAGQVRALLLIFIRREFSQRAVKLACKRCNKIIMLRHICLFVRLSVTRHNFPRMRFWYPNLSFFAEISTKNH